MKTFIYSVLFTLVLFVNIAYAQVVVEWSADNVSWNPFSQVDQGNKTACQSFLEQNTEYFVRAKDSVSGFGYELVRTLFGGLNEKMIEVAIILIAAIALFMFFGVFIDSFGAKIFFFGIAFLEFLILLFVSYMNEFNSAVESILRINFHGMLLIIGGLFIYAVIYFLMLKASPDSDEAGLDEKWKEE